MKALIILLILSSCYFATQAQVVSDNGTTITVNNNSTTETGAETETNLESNGEFIDIDPQQVDNNYFILALISYGSQVVSGRASDSQLTQGTGNYSKIYSVSYESGDTLNIVANVQLSISYYTNLHSIFEVNFDPNQGSVTLNSYSFEWQNYSLSEPSGVNISYTASNDQYEVIDFSGFEETLNYQSGNTNAKSQSYSGKDFLGSFGNWTSTDISGIYNDTTLQYALNAGLRGLRSQSYNSLLQPYDDLNVTALHSIDNYTANGTGTYYRFDFEFTTLNQSGRAVTVVLCPLYISYPYWPPGYPIQPLSFAANGAIESSAASENAGSASAGGVSLPVTAAEGTVAVDKVNAAAVDGSARLLQNSTSSDASGAAASSNSSAAGTSASEPIIINPPPSGYYSFDCIYGSLNYYYFINYKSSTYL